MAAPGGQDVEPGPELGHGPHGQGVDGHDDLARLEAPGGRARRPARTPPRPRRRPGHRCPRPRATRAPPGSSSGGRRRPRRRGRWAGRRRGRRSRGRGRRGSRRPRRSSSTAGPQRRRSRRAGEEVMAGMPSGDRRRWPSRRRSPRRACSAARSVAPPVGTKLSSRSGDPAAEAGVVGERCHRHVHGHVHQRDVGRRVLRHERGGLELAVRARPSRCAARRRGGRRS